MDTKNNSYYEYIWDIIMIFLNIFFISEWKVDISLWPVNIFDTRHTSKYGLKLLTFLRNCRNLKFLWRKLNLNANINGFILIILPKIRNSKTVWMGNNKLKFIKRRF